MGLGYRISKGGAMSAGNPKPMIVRSAFASIQVCAPVDHSDEQIRNFAEAAFPSGTEHGWQVRKQGDPALRSDPERNPCEKRAGCIHVTLDA